MTPVLIAAAALLCAAVLLLILYIRSQRKAEQLRINIEDFIESGKTEEFSTGDGHLARLQNSIAELEELLVLERSNSASETRRNADFVADISHQLKTPLAGIRLYCEMDKDSKTALHTEKQLQLISKMENLINNLLKLEKLRSDAYTMEFSEHALEGIADEVVNGFQIMFPEKRYSVSGSAVMRCDRNWISEALGNIIKNAGEHTAPDGRISVVIEKTERSVTLIVEDDGGGVPGEQLALLFDRFYRTEKAAANSAGIGLAISKTIFEKHHATVTAENGIHGLKITVCFPIIDAGLKI